MIDSLRRAGTALAGLNAPAASGVTTETLFSILSNSRRQHITRLVTTTTGTVSVRTAARGIAAVENDKPEGDVSSTEYNRVYIALTQTHIGKLRDAGIVAVNGTEREIRAGKNAPAAMRLLEKADSMTA